ncbi:MAG TPA: methylated-DNA--[protein]-cysteine S-methyltransferase [Candidatus Cybelea sp.]|nr:methylated-DNA--[protein]-cysteine S-methyltransferase [Candidatus Cybelea sp.]
MAKTVSLVFELNRLPTPIGTALIATDSDGRLRVFDWETHADRMQRGLDRLYGRGKLRLVEPKRASAEARAVLDCLEAYFAGDIAAIEAIPVESAGTQFQRACWAALRKIPAGETWSYGRLARRVGRPDAVRAAGAANGLNPISVVVPCHRVIGADGSLTGYGGGLDRKRWLLRHEGVLLRDAA